MLEGLKKRFDGVKAALAEAVSGVTALKSGIEKLKREQQHLRTAPPCKADPIPNLHQPN